MATDAERELAFLIQFMHPRKILNLPGVTDEVIAAAFGTDMATYLRIKDGFAQNARAAARELLSEASLAAAVDRLPFARGAKVVALGDSITDGLQSWAEILRYLLEFRRAAAGIAVVNAGLSGNTTSEMYGRFLQEVAHQRPDWILCMAGTNDARAHGRAPVKTMLGLEETIRNFEALRRFSRTQTDARWVWLTPPPIIPERIASHWQLAPRQLSWSNEHLRVIGEAMLGLPDPVIDLQAVFGVPPGDELLSDDGLHPSLAGQKAIARALVLGIASEA